MTSAQILAATDNGWRQGILQQIYSVFENDNALSRCCALKTLQRLAARDQQSKQHILTLLNDPDPDVRMDAALVVGELGITEAVAILAKGLASDIDGEVRIEQARALAKLHSTDAVEPLLRCFEAEGYPQLDGPRDELEYSTSWEVQRQALLALGEIKDARVARNLIAFLEKEDCEELQETGFMVLARLEPKLAEDFLLQQLKSGNSLSRRRAIKALKCLAGPHTPSTKVTQALCQALIDAQPEVRLAAAHALNETNDPVILVSLIQLLNDQDSTVRKELAVVLGKMHGTEIISRLHNLLPESGNKQKNEIIRILAEIGDPESSDILSDYLLSEDADQLYEVVRAIRNIGLCNKTWRLAEILDDKNRHWALRVETVRALQTVLANADAKQTEETHIDESGEERKGPEPIQLLYSVLHDTDERVVHAALMALSEIDPQNLKELLMDLLRVDQEDSEQIETIESEVNGPGETIDNNNELAELLEGKNPETSTLAAILENSMVEEVAEIESQTADIECSDTLKILAIRFLGNSAYPDSEAVTVLTDLFECDGPGLRREILLALAHIGDEKAVPIILRALEDPSVEIRLAALEASESLADAVVLQGPLATLCQDQNVSIRHRAIEVLAKMPGTGGIIWKSLEDEELDVCRTALRLVPEITDRQRDLQAILDLAFRFGGELRFDVGATLRRLKEFAPTSQFLAMLDEPEQEQNHWICIDVLGEMHATENRV